MATGGLNKDHILDSGKVLKDLLNIELFTHSNILLFAAF